jgi:large conductance mechanosensitive channel
MLRGFKDFILRGSVVDLAVGIVIGAAFSSVVGQFTKSFLEPMIRLVTGGAGPIDHGVVRIRGESFDGAAFVNSVVAFLLTAVVLYFIVVLPMNKLAERLARGREPRPAAPSEEVVLLREIRDALVESAPDTSAGGQRPRG